MRYRDFVDLSYRPSEGEVICDFFLEPSDMDMEEAAGAVAAESSIGTWTELTTLQRYMEMLGALVFHIEGNNIRVAYPFELFELGNMANILSSVAGNIFGLGALKNLRLQDIYLPEALIRGFKGPKYGIKGIRDLLKVPERPLVGTIIKPKLGLKTRDHAKVAYDAWSGGCDLVKDDENLSNQRFNPFEDRVVETLEMRDRAGEETGERKAYLANVTAETEEMIKRAQFVEEKGGEYIMVDILTCGFSALQTLRERGFDLVIHAHRAGHAAFTKNPKHGISMNVIAKLTRIVGVDQLHIGSAIGKMSETRGDVVENSEALRGEMYGIRPVLPVASGGLHPRLVPTLMGIFGYDLVIQAGGGIHGHPGGTATGAMAIRQAVDAVLRSLPLDEYAETHQELRRALDHWRV